MTLERHGERSVGRQVAETIFSAHAVTYVFVNVLCVFLWVVTGRGYFWPIWVMGPWGFALAMHSWVTWGMRFRR